MLSRAEDVAGLEGYGGIRVMIKNPHCKHQVEFPSGSKGACRFRIIPEIRQTDSGSYYDVPFMSDPEHQELSYWYWKEKMFRGGVNGEIMIFSRLGNEDGTGYDIYTPGPVEVFSVNMNNKLGPRGTPHIFDQVRWHEWSAWVIRSANRPPRIPNLYGRQGKYGFFQVVMFPKPGRPAKVKNGVVTPMFPVLFVCPESVHKAFESLTTTEVQGYNGDPRDICSRYLCGDFISLRNGKVISVELGEQVFSRGDGRVSTSPVKVYNVTIEHQNVYPLTGLDPAKLFTPWHKLLRFHTAQQQIEALLSVFPHEAVDLGLRGSQFYDLLPSQVRGSFDVKPVSYGYQAQLQPQPAANVYAYHQQHAVTQPFPPGTVSQIPVAMPKSPAIMYPIQNQAVGYEQQDYKLARDRDEGNNNDDVAFDLPLHSLPPVPASNPSANSVPFVANSPTVAPSGPEPVLTPVTPYVPAPLPNAQSSAAVSPALNAVNNLSPVNPAQERQKAEEVRQRMLQAMRNNRQ